jgi:gas vesicle protein
MPGEREAIVAKRDSGGFVAGLLVGGLVGAALALLYAPRGGQGTPEALLEQSRSALRARFESATQEAQQAATETEQRLAQEYRSATQGE